MDRLSYMIKIVQSLNELEHNCGVNFREQRIALKEAIDAEVKGLVNSKEPKHSYAQS